MFTATLPTSLAVSHDAIGLVAIINDYGTQGSMVGSLEGAIYSAYPQARISTITNEVDYFNVAQASYLLSVAAFEYPPGTVFVAGVDPGVGTKRRSIVLETKDGKMFVGPDNGIFTGVIARTGMARAYEITNMSLIRKGSMSASFHGRDVYGPIAGHLAAGLPPEAVGPEIVDPVLLSIKDAVRNGSSIEGSVVYVNPFGNIITNIPAEMLSDAGVRLCDMLNLTVGGQNIKVPLLSTYGDVPKGEWLALIGEQETLEIARNMENAAKSAGVREGAGIVIAKE